MAERDLPGEAGKHVEAGGNHDEDADRHGEIEVIRVGGHERHGGRRHRDGDPAGARAHTRRAGRAPPSPHGRTTSIAMTTAKPTISRAPVET